MKSIDLTPLYKNSVGFDRLDHLLNDALSDRAQQKLPAYNVEALDDNRYAITVAVPGYRTDDLNVQTESGILTVTGQPPAQEGQTILHQGISHSPFEMSFRLADYVEVTEASLKDGLLLIQLRKELPESMKPRRITIGEGPQALEHQSSSDKAA